MTQHTGPPVQNTPAGRPTAPEPAREARWENEGGATRLPASVAAARAIPAGLDRPTARRASEQPRLYADLLAEADRRRQAADDRLVRGMIALRDPVR